MLRAEDHPGDREIRDIVSIFATTRSARARTKKGRRERKEKNGGGKNKAISERKHVKSIVNRLRLCPREFYDFLPRGKVTAMRSSLRLREKRPRNIRPEDGERVRRRAGEKGEEEGGCEKIAETRLENPDGSRYFRAQKRYDAVPFRVRAR